jgi:hypothetical protein
MTSIPSSTRGRGHPSPHRGCPQRDHPPASGFFRAKYLWVPGFPSNRGDFLIAGSCNFAVSSGYRTPVHFVAAPNGYTRLLPGRAVTFCYRTRLALCASTGRWDGPGGPPGRPHVRWSPWQAGLAQHCRWHVLGRPGDCVRGSRITAGQAQVQRPAVTERRGGRECGLSLSRGSRGSDGGIRAGIGHRVWGGAALPQVTGLERFSAQDC